MNKDYRDVEGAIYTGHPPIRPFQVRIVNREHPIFTTECSASLCVGNSPLLQDHSVLEKTATSLCVTFCYNVAPENPHEYDRRQIVESDGRNRSGRTCRDGIGECSGIDSFTGSCPDCC
jgi:hypothetical protein